MRKLPIRQRRFVEKRAALRVFGEQIEMEGVQVSGKFPKHSKSRAEEFPEAFSPEAEVVFYTGDCLDFLRSLPDGLARLVVTSPPYNIGKRYERRIRLDDYLKGQERVEQIVNQLSGIGGRRPMGFGKERVRSLPDAIAQVLAEHIDLTEPGV